MDHIGISDIEPTSVILFQISEGREEKENTIQDPGSGNIPIPRPSANVQNDIARE